MHPALDSITFARLQTRLIGEVRARLSNGEFTERGLARMIGISQPHIHNVLKGCRNLTVEIADSILQGVGLSVTDLIAAKELGGALEDRRENTLAFRSVPLLSGRLGPRDMFPERGAAVEWIRMPEGEIRGAKRPALVELGDDPELSWVFPHSRYALLDTDETGRSRPARGGWYALRWRGAGLLRQVRREKGRLAVMGQRTLTPEPWPEEIELNASSLLQVVRGRVDWVGGDPRAPGVLAQSGEWVRPVAASW